MKRLLFLLVAFALSYTTHSQMIRVNGYETILSPKKAEEIPEDLKKIQYKKYLTQDYKTSSG